jgi:hypothetical protein
LVPEGDCFELLLRQWHGGGAFDMDFAGVVWVCSLQESAVIEADKAGALLVEAVATFGVVRGREVTRG